MGVFYSLRIHVPATPVYTMQPALTDTQRRDSSAFATLVTREKTAEKVPLQFFLYNLLAILHLASGQALTSLICFPCLEKNNCSDNTHDCHAKAVCNNFEGSYRCSCEEGYQGDGRNCTGEVHRNCSSSHSPLILTTNLINTKVLIGKIVNAIHL